MTLSTTDRSLSDAEFERLGDFLEGAGLAAMNLEMLDGFFAALLRLHHTRGPLNPHDKELGCRETPRMALI